jgi:hypothetical protein
VNRYLHTLTVQSVRELVRYKSFFLLILLLIAADRLVHRFVDVEGIELDPANIVRMGPDAAEFVFQAFPAIIRERVVDYRTGLLLVGMFLFKQLISLWPSSDMRRMHRRERTGLGFVASLLALRWRQVAWDGIALASVCTIAATWILSWFVVCRLLWLQTAAPGWALLWGTAALLAAPLLMAGFSYSSKIAVLSEGGLLEKLGLYFKLFLDKRILSHSWLFFLARCLVEFIFVVAIPGLAILLIPWFAVRIFVGGLSMILVYPYLKMATFKFFLELYSQYPSVRREYAGYYASQNQTETSEARASGDGLASDRRAA